jgi:hypothetical protein
MAARAWATTFETNVVDRFGFAHEVPNLGILGASVKGTSGAHDPTLTTEPLLARTYGKPSLLVFTHCPLKAVRRANLPVVRPALKSTNAVGRKGAPGP